MQHADQANLPADKPRVARQLLSRFGRGPKEEMVDQGLLAARHGPEWAGQREGEHEVRHGQLQVELSFEPALGVLVLTLGAMAVATRVVEVLGFAAVGTGIDVPAQRRGAALLNRPHHLCVAGRHCVAKLGAIRRSILAEDLGQFYHGTSAMTRLMASLASWSAG